MEPPVSDPSAPKQRRAATAAPEPPDDPPEIRCRSHGLRTGPKWLCADVSPYANSCMFVLPTRTVPACLSRRTTSASCDGTRSASSSARDVQLGGPGVDKRLIGGHRDERVQHGIQPFDSREARVGEFHG